MITVIIAGGSGTRLWPLSTPKYPKHLLKLTGERTLLQTAYDRATKIGDKIYVVTESSHSDLVREQLPELPDEAFLIEPGRRGTAHCIIFALDAISRVHDHDEPVAFIHSDHHVRDIGGFARSFSLAAKVSQANNQITLIGIEPTFPSTGFGYIERDGVKQVDGGVFDVESFKEKPDYETAKKYVESGNYLWNCGYFVGSVSTFLSEMRLSAPDLYNNFEILASIPNIHNPEYNEKYLEFDNQVIDIALIEKANSLAVVAANFDWMDVGSFKDLHDVVPRDESGNYYSGDNIHAIDVTNVYIRNEESDKPIAVIGLDNIVVVNTPDGILVSRKDVSHRTGEVAKKLQSNS
jgi:mannose-1-phosphate guanylyltransferase/mannose-6-phosphate isomerase